MLTSKRRADRTKVDSTKVCYICTIPEKDEALPLPQHFEN